VYVWASCLSRIIALQNFPIHFPHSGVKIRANQKPEVPVRLMVRAEYHGLLRRVVLQAAPCNIAILFCVVHLLGVSYTIALLGHNSNSTLNQGRNEKGQGGATPRAPNHCGVRRNVPTISQLLSSMQ